MQTTRRFFYGTNWSPAANSGQRGSLELGHRLEKGLQALGYPETG